MAHRETFPQVDCDVPTAVAWIAFRGAPIQVNWPADLDEAAGESTDERSAAYALEVDAALGVADRWAVALDELNNAVAHGLIESRGQKANHWKPPTTEKAVEPIPSKMITNARRIGLDGSLSIQPERSGWGWLNDEGPFYHGICFRVADVQRVWPPLADTATVSAVIETPLPSSTRTNYPTTGGAISSGVAGRPSCADIAKDEMRRRATEGNLSPSIGQEARVLVQFLHGMSADTTLPADIPTARALENSIRELHRELLRSTA